MNTEGVNAHHVLVNWLEEAESKSRAFAAHLAEARQGALTYGTLRTVNGEIRVTVFGHECIASPRTVIADEVYVEYEFVVHYRGTDYPIACLYVGMRGRLHTGASKDSDVMDTGNIYADRAIINMVADGLRRSVVFQPTSGQPRPAA
jgi:hypothetical protein